MFCSSEQMEMQWVGNWIGKRASISPDTIGIFDKGCNQKFTFKELNSRANKTSNFLLENDINKGDKVCVISRNRIEIVDLFFAAGKTGAVLSPISYRLAATEINDLIDRIQPKAIFFEDFFQDLFNSLNIPKSVTTVIKLTDDSANEFDTKVLIHSDNEANTPLKISDTFLLIHTGGTTSTPKICKVSHQQVIWNSVELAASSSSRICSTSEIITLPFFHIGGWNIFVPHIHFGGYAILIRSFDPKEVIELINQEKVKILPLATPMALMLSNHPDFDSCSFESVDIVFTGGSKCQPEIMQPFWDKGIQTAQSYGLTEAGPSNFIFIPAEDRMDLVKDKSDTIGLPMFHCDYKIMSETGEEVPPGKAGILYLRSLHNFDGYLNDDERTSTITTKDGWIISGDLAIASDDGFVSIIGRSDNMFISGGENISPEEIEDALLKHKEVDEAVCIGIDDTKWGQVPIANVVIKKGSNTNKDELLQFCSKHLAKFKLPRDIFFVEEIPKTGANKLDRNAVIKEHKKS